MGLFVTLITGAVAGWLAAQMVKGEGFGLVGNVVVGIIGAVIAGFVLPLLGWTGDGSWFLSVVHATIGAVILLVLIRVVKQV
ncbi:MAG: GlsB/YeaQ/YmgE family stress response membrane protein [Pseudomonadota bacterium]